MNYEYILNVWVNEWSRGCNWFPNILPYHLCYPAGPTPLWQRMLLPCIAQGKFAAGAPRISQSCTHKAEQNHYLIHYQLMPSHPPTVPSLWAQPHRSRIQLFYVNPCLSFMKRAGNKEQFYITPADCSIRPHINTQSDGMLLLMWNTLSLHCSMLCLCD